jgi:hypothetical protein
MIIGLHPFNWKGIPTLSSLKEFQKSSKIKVYFVSSLVLLTSWQLYFDHYLSLIDLSQDV